MLPRLVDVHTHIDKGHIWQRAQNPDGTLMGARMAVMADREANWSRDDVRQAAWTSRCVAPSRTAPARCAPTSTAIGKQTADLLARCSPRCASSGRAASRCRRSSLFPIEFAIDDDAANFRAMVETVAKHGGAARRAHASSARRSNAKIDAALDKVFEAASANGLDLDFHVDESDSPLARTLPRIADAALRNKFKGRIVAGHCCSLALADDNERAAIIAKVAEARIAVVSLPMCNMYLQDRVGGPHAALAWRRAAA